jgi:hypothetical protein
MASRPHPVGSAKFAKSIVESAMKEGILKPTVTAKDLLDLIPSDGDLSIAGGVLAWSGYCLVYPSVTPEEKS